MRKLMRNRAVVVAASLIGLLAVLAVAQAVLDRAAEAQSKGAGMAPRFEVDPMWPKPMPSAASSVSRPVPMRTFRFT